MADFFDKLKSSVIKGANVVADKSEQLVESTKLKGARMKLENEMEKNYTELGKLFFEMMEADDLRLELLRSKCTMLGHLKAQIEDMKEEEERIKERKGQD